MESSWKIERLSDQIGIYVSPQHRFGTDAFLLAHFAGARHKDRVCDLGTGCGIIPLLLWRDFAPRQVFGVELQRQGFLQFQKSVEESGLAGQVVPLQGDLRELDETVLSPGSFDLVTCNPPYKASGAGILSDTPAEQAARHEIFCTIGDVCRAGARLLKYGGRLCVCNRPERLADCVCAMREQGIEPKRLRFVAKYPDSAPWLFLLEGKKGSAPFLQVEPVLAVQGENGFSQELLRIYGKGEN